MNEVQKFNYGAGRPQERKNPQLLHLYIEKEAKIALKDLSIKYGLSMSRVVENLVLKAVKEDSYILELEKENEELKKRVKELEKENQKLKELLERINSKRTKTNTKVEKIKSKIEEIFAYRREIKVAELVSFIFGIPLGDASIHTYASKFITEYFEDQGDYLISQQLGVIIKKDRNYKLVGWKAEKL
ncbi:hypothetical protein [Thermococcus sp. 2319x1]|uniref:hypothetical protein n=1 Tax=Thermococcus sp. 2319x1 TaxID=1674923 RepID=UPI0015827D3B|nr:hypothetical protein [Thermococcus sp. 2319x1]